ncbi:MAG: hypothetical protein ABIG89_05645 [Candidatus Woesearchaeota archaeon]
MKYIINKCMLLLLLVFIISIVSCTSNSSTSTEYKTGKEGINMELLNMKQGSKFVQGEYLSLVMDIQNKGYFSQPDGFITIKGHDPNAIHFKETVFTLPSLLGKRSYMPEGGSNIIKFDEEKPLTVPYGSSYKANLMFTACYNYETQAVVSVCVIPDMKEYTAGTTTCRLEAKSLSSQAAPVAVTYIEPSMSADKLQYIIHVTNVGDGVVVKRDKINQKDCPSNIGSIDVDEMKIAVSLSALGEAECENDNIIRLIDGKGVALCSIGKGTGAYSYTTQMEIVLDYGYSSNIFQEIEIINPFYTGKEEYNK